MVESEVPYPQKKKRKESGVTGILTIGIGSFFAKWLVSCQVHFDRQLSRSGHNLYVVYCNIQMHIY